MVDEKYIKSVNIIVEDEGDINVTDKSRRSNYSTLISKGDEVDIDVISERQNSLIQQ